MATFEAIDLNTVDQATVAQAALTIGSLLNQVQADWDVTPGTVLNRFLVDPWALLSTINQAKLNTLTQGWSLQDLMTNPTASTAIIDKVLANYFVTRRPAGKAIGKIVIVLAQPATTSISASAIFTASTGKTYRPTNSFIGVVDASSVLTDNDRLIFVNGTQYSFVIDVAAVDAGADSQAARGTTFTSDAAIPGLVTAYADDDFSGGRPEETNLELAMRLEPGLSARSMADRSSIRAAISTQVDSTLAVSIIGFGDAEMLRDRANLFGVSTGGKADLYVRTDYLPASRKFTMTATCVDQSAKRMRLHLTRDVFPGCYRTVSVLNTGSGALGTLEIVAEEYDLDMTPDARGNVPTIPEFFYGTFSPFQTMTVDFTDPFVNLADPTTWVYDITLQGMPELDTLQFDLVSLRGRADPRGDYLIRAPIPCFVSVGLTVAYRPQYGVPVSANIASAVALAVNSLDFSAENLPAAVILEAAASAMVGVSAHVQLPIDLRGTLLLPEGSTQQLSGTNSLVVSPETSLGVSPRNTAFFLDAANVTVTLKALANTRV